MNIELATSMTYPFQRTVADKLKFTVNGQALSYMELIDLIVNNPLSLLALAKTSDELGIDVPLGFVQFGGMRGTQLIIKEYYPLINQDTEEDPVYGELMGLENEYELEDLLVRPDLQAIYDKTTADVIYELVERAAFADLMNQIGIKSESEPVRPAPRNTARARYPFYTGENLDEIARVMESLSRKPNFNTNNFKS